MKCILRSFFALIIFIVSLHAEIVVSKNPDSIPLLKKSKVYITDINKTDIENLIKQPDLFKPYHKDFISRGFDDKHEIWIKFTLKNPTSQTIERVVSFRNVNLERLVFYTVDKHRVLNVEYDGLFYRKKFDGIFLLHFNIKLPSHAERIFYLKVSNQMFSLNISPVLKTTAHFLHTDIDIQIAWVFFVTVLFTVFLYNTIFFIFTRDSIYFYYAFYLSSIFLVHQYLYGLLLHFAPIDDPIFVKKQIDMNLYYGIYISFTMILFIQNFLETKQYPKIHKILYLILILSAIELFTIPYNLLSWKSMSLIYFTLSIFYFFVGVYALYKKNIYAKYFVIAWGIALLGWMSLFFKGLNIFTTLAEFPYTFEVCITTEILLFSFAISKRVHDVYQERERLSKILQNHNKQLEKIVKERTSDLKVELDNNKLLLQELHHRMKNNMLFISSLYALKLDNNDKKLLKKLHDIERKIYAMSKVHEMLYAQKNLRHIDSKEYFKKVLDTIQQAFDCKQISFYSEIETNLQVEDAIYCGLIVNELVTNALKYAFDEKGGNIYIILKRQDEKTLLEIADNGNGGIDINSSGFGIMMVQTLVKDQLEGELSINTRRGSKISIIF